MEVVGLAGLLSELGVVGNSNRRNQATSSTETETETAVLSSSSITVLQTLIDETDGAQLWDYLSECNIQPSVLVASLAASMESKSSHLSLLASRAYLSALLSSSAPIHTLFDPFTFFSLLFSLRHSTKPTVPSDGSRSQSSTLRERKKKRKGRSGEKSAEEEEHTEVDGLLIFVLELVESFMSIVRLDRMTDGVKSLVETVVVVLESGIVQRLRRISDICFGILYEAVVRPEHGDQTESSAQVLRSLSPVMLSHSKSGLKSEVIQFVLRRLMPFGKGNEKVRKALVYLPRYLAMTAPEKTELRACAVDTILAILRVMEMEDQIGFVDYVVKMCNSKESFRLLGLDILLMILMACDALGVRRLENDQGDDVDCHLDVKKCFEVIVQRCSDSVAKIRSRALVNTGQAIEFLSKDSKNHSWLQKTMMHTSFNNLLRMRCVDDKAAVRKSTLVLIMKSTTLSGVSIDEEVLKMMAHACSDPLLSIRKAALLALSEAFRKNVESKIITTWLHAVPPLIMDNETSIQEECANLFLELILDWISRVGFVKLEDNIQNLEISFPSSLLALMKEMCDEEITMNIKKICTSLGKKNKLKVSYAIALQNIITASEMAWKNSNIAIEKWIAPPGAWMLLSELSPFVSKAIGWKFLHHHWKLLDKENEVASHGDLNETELVSATWITDRVSLLQIISNVSMGLPQEASADLAYNLLKRIEGFNMHLTEVDAHIKALKTLCKKKAVKPGEGDVLVLKWVDQVKSKALNIFETYLSKNSAANDLRNSVTPRATKKKESEETSKVVNAIFVIGSLVLICPSADFKAVIPLLHSIMTSKTSKGKPKKLAGLIDSLKEVASSLYIQSWVTMGKICLVDGKLAARYIPLFVQELESNSAAMRNNILLVMGDFCVQHTALVDCYISRIANLLRDPCEIIRMQTFTLLSRLMQRDYVKWRGVLFLQFLLLLVDESEKIRNLADYLFGSILKVKAPLLAYNSFVEAIFVLNDCHTHSGHSAKSKTKVQNFSLRGNDATSRSKRMHIYVSLLKQMAPEQLLATSAKLCAEILASASDGMLNLDDITAQCVLQDSLEILACKEMRIQVPRASDTTDMDEEGEVGRSLLEARGRAVTQVSKKNLIQHAVPIFIELKRLLENRNSSLTGCLMECLCVLLKDYKNEIDDILVADKQLQKELIYDMQKYEAAKTRNKVNNAIRRTNGLVLPANLRTSVADLSEKLGTATKITSAVADVAAKVVARSVMKDINGNMPTPSVHTMSIPKVKTSIVNGSRTTLPMDVLQSLRKRQVADFDAVA